MAWSSRWSWVCAEDASIAGPLRLTSLAALAKPHHLFLLVVVPYHPRANVVGWDVGAPDVISTTRILAIVVSIVGW